MMTETLVTSPKAGQDFALRNGALRRIEKVWYMTLCDVWRVTYQEPALDRTQGTLVARWPDGTLTEYAE